MKPVAVTTHNYENVAPWNQPPHIDLNETVVYAEAEELDEYARLSDQNNLQDVYFNIEQNGEFLDAQLGGESNRRCSMASTGSKLVPFLDCVEPEAKTSHIPMLSSTSVSPSHIVEQMLPTRGLSPIRRKEAHHHVAKSKIYVPKGKKIQSLSDMKFVPS
jgi:hypothetical protein